MNFIFWVLYLTMTVISGLTIGFVIMHLRGYSFLLDVVEATFPGELLSKKKNKFCPDEIDSTYRELIRRRISQEKYVKVHEEWIPYIGDIVRQVGTEEKGEILSFGKGFTGVRYETAISNGRTNKYLSKDEMRLVSCVNLGQQTEYFFTVEDESELERRQEDVI